MVTRTVLRSGAESMRPPAGNQCDDYCSPLICSTWPSSFCMRTRTCLRSVRSPSNSCWSFSASSTAASRSARKADTRSTVWRIRSSRLARASTSASILDLFERGFRLIHQGRKCRRIVHGHVSQDFAVQVDARFLQTAHEAAVGNLGRAAGCSDAYDPQGAEIAFLAAASDEPVAQRLFHRFLRGSIELALGEEESLS